MAHVSTIGNAKEQYLPMFVIMMYVYVAQDISKLAGSATQVKQVEFIMISIISWLRGKYYKHESRACLFWQLLLTSLVCIY